MIGKTNRRVAWKDCLAYCEYNKKPITFCCSFKGKIAKKVGKNNYRKSYGGIDAIFVPDGFTKPASEISTAQYLKFWSDENNYDSWKRLLEYLS